MPPVAVSPDEASSMEYLVRGWIVKAGISAAVVAAAVPIRFSRRAIMPYGCYGGVSFRLGMQ